MEKDSSLTEPVFLGLNKIWPKMNSPKEVLLLMEVEEIVELVTPECFQKIREPFAHLFARCVSCPHFQVSSKHLYC